MWKYFEFRDPNPPLHGVWGAHWPRGENFIEFAWGQDVTNSDIYDYTNHVLPKYAGYYAYLCNT